MKKKNKGLIFIVVLLLTITIIASSIGLWAWAKYTSAQSGNATAQIAKWCFDLRLKEGKSGATETSGPIDLASTQFNHVANDRIAPGTSGLFYVIVDTTGTEVDVFYNVNITLENCPRNIKFYRGTNNSGEELSLGGVDSTSRTFSFSRYLHAKGTNGNENGQKDEPIFWEWEYSGSVNNSTETYDQWDTADSNLGTTRMTITATGTEMLSDPNAVVEDTGGDPTAANSVRSLAQAGTIQRWDLVNYNPGNGTSTSITLPDGASLNSTISAASITNWVVLDINQTTGEVLLIPYIPDYQYTGLADLGLSGKGGYNNAIESLDMVAGLYKNDDYAKSARSIKIEDIESIAESTFPSRIAIGPYTWNHRYGIDNTTFDITDTGDDENTPLQTYQSNTNNRLLFC